MSFINIMRHGGFEPPTTWLKVKCSTNWASIPSSSNRRKCPEPESNQWHEDFQSSALPTELSGHRLKNKSSSGDRIWTYDLRVMSPTSFQTAPPRVIKLTEVKWMEKDSNLRRRSQQIYSLLPLATRESIHIKADSRSRTNNLLITNQLLCHWAMSANNGTNRARTYDPLLVRQMLSQLSYDPILH